MQNFYVGWELTFLLIPTDREPQGKGSRGVGVRAGALASLPVVPSKASRDGGCWGQPRAQSKSTVMRQVPDQARMAHLWVTSAAQIKRVPGQAWHRCITAVMQLWWDLRGEQLLKSCSHVKLEEPLPRPSSNSFLEEPSSQSGSPTPSSRSALKLLVWACAQGPGIYLCSAKLQ